MEPQTPETKSLIERRRLPAIIQVQNLQLLITLLDKMDTLSLF